MSEEKWGRFEELRPDQLQEMVDTTPVAYWPLGLIEHHGWALPSGFDGVKAQRYCERLAGVTGGVLLPTMWWGSGGGHGDFKWTFYQDREAGEKILRDTVEKLIEFGFRAIVVFAGHYPWDGPMNDVLTPIRDAHPEILIQWGFECTIGGDDIKAPGDHASRWETAYGLALLPDLVDLDALKPGRSDRECWPPTGPVGEEGRIGGMSYDASEARFAQLGEDPALASAEEAEEWLAKITDKITGSINTHLNTVISSSK